MAGIQNTFSMGVARVLPFALCIAILAFATWGLFTSTYHFILPVVEKALSICRAGDINCMCDAGELNCRIAKHGIVIVYK